MWLGGESTPAVTVGVESVDDAPTQVVRMRSGKSLDGEEWQGLPHQVILRAAIKTPDEVAAERELDRQRAEHRQRVRMGFGREPLCNADIFHRFAAACDIQDRVERARKDREYDERIAYAAEALTYQEMQAAEREAGKQSRRASATLDGRAADRRRRQRQELGRRVPGCIRRLELLPPLMKPPPSRAAWLLKGELTGHTPTETIAYSSWCGDYQDEQQRQRTLPAQFISPNCEPRPITRLPRLFGR